MSITADATQATQIEMSRAVAQVLGAMEGARRWPRDEDAARDRFLTACARPAFAERAFWRFSRGGEQLTGPTIAFAEEAARNWGNLDSGSVELVRRPGESDMRAFAADLQTNYTRSTIFVNPHIGYVDTPKLQDDGTWKQGRTLRSMRDIRENNQSAGSRNEREMLLSVLPSWYIEEGIACCYRTLAGNSTEPIEDRRRKCADAFTEIEVPRSLLVAKVGVPFDAWLPADIATLRVIFQSIKRGETTINAEFAEVMGRNTVPAGPASVSTTDLAGAQAAPAPPADSAPVDTTDEVPPAAEQRAPQRTLSAIAARLTELGYEGRAGEQRERRLRLMYLITGEQVETMSDLTPGGASHARTYLSTATADDLAALLAQPDGDDEDRAAAEDQ